MNAPARQAEVTLTAPSRLAQAKCRQASTLLGVARLYHPDILVENEATAAQ